MDRIGQIKHIIVVLSGKGGVGKSTVACQLAFALAARNPESRVGLLDVDICGPSVPKICGVETGSVTRTDQGWEPVTVQSNLAVMSIAFLLTNADDAVVWRGPRKDAMIKQFLTEVNWGPLDFLIVDTPPGTSDEHITLCECIRGYDPTGAVVVTTPQSVSVDDVRKELSFCHKLKLRCLGIVENMSGFVCPHCAECTELFSTGGGERLANEYDTEFLGRIPIDPALCLAEDMGRPFLESPQGESISPSVAAIHAVVESILKQVRRVEAMRSTAAAEQPPQ